jgi:hypothetical protein
MATAEALVQLGMRNRRGWIVAAEYSLTDRVFLEVYRLVQEIPELAQGIKKLVYSRTERRIEMEWGSFLEGKSADNPRSLKGARLDYIIVDEAAELAGIIWRKYLQARLVDRKGWALFISTPMGKNWYYQTYRNAFKPDTRLKGWRAIHSPTWDNPWMDEEELDAIRLTIDDREWEEEYGAKFISSSGLIWSGYVDRLYPHGHLYDPKDVPVRAFWTHYGGLDIGLNHPTSANVVAVPPHSMKPKGFESIGNDSAFLHFNYQDINENHEAHAKAILASCPYPVYSWVGSRDSRRRVDLTASVQDRRTVHDVYSEAGLFILPVSPDVKVSISDVSRRLKATLEGNSAAPGLLISTDCEYSREAFLTYEYEELSVQSRDKRDAPDRPKKRKDDQADSIRYNLSRNPMYIASPYANLDQGHGGLDLSDRYGGVKVPTSPTSRPRIGRSGKPAFKRPR